MVSTFWTCGQNVKTPRDSGEANGLLQHLNLENMLQNAASVSEEAGIKIISCIREGRVCVCVCVEGGRGGYVSCV